MENDISEDTRVESNLNRTYKGPSTPDDNESPPEIFEQLHREFGFTVDVAANKFNAKCPKFYTKEDDGLKQDWSGEVVWCAPPNSTKLKNAFIKKAWEESRKGTTVVLFIPCDTSTVIFAKYVSKGHLRLITKRIHFYTHGVRRKTAASIPSLICTFDTKLLPKVRLVDIDALEIPVDIEPVLVDVFTNIYYPFDDVASAIKFLGGWVELPEAGLAEHILTGSTKRVGKFRVFTKSRPLELLEYMRDDTV